MEEGFFTKKETESISRPGGKTYSCASCGLLKTCKSPRMLPYGKGVKGIMILSEAPTMADDQRNKMWQGQDEKFFINILSDLGVDIFEDCVTISAVNCLPKDTDGDEIEVETYHIDCCRKTVMKYIEEIQPKIIITLGFSGLYSLIGHRWKKDFGEIKKWRGWQIPDQDLKTWICPTSSLEYVRHSKEIALTILKKDITQALQTLNRDFPIFEVPHVEVIEDLSVLGEITPDIYDLVSFDYETTGLKPHAPGQRIVCGSVCMRDDHVYVFMIPENRQDLLPFRELLNNSDIGKISHNMKFEDHWTEVRLRTSVNNWAWDSMLATHVLDNRPDICSLKFQTYVNFGVIDYDSEISPYLKSGKKDSNALNRINDLLLIAGGKEKLLKYCGWDSVFTFKLAKIQMEKIRKSPGLTKAYQLFHNGLLALNRAERQGLRIDCEYIEKAKEGVSIRIEEMERDFKQSPFFKDWQKHSKTPINLNSGDQLGIYLYEIKNLKPLKLTKNKKGSTDKDALQLLNIPELDSLIQIGKLKKVRDTYLEAFNREQINGFMHPFYNLHNVITYRGSCDSPNFMNIPKRDKEAMKICRDSIYPRKGNRLMEADFKGIEVGISTTYNKDPNLIEYVSGHGDMHGDMAKQIFFLSELYPKLPEHKLLRNAAKNGFTFPQFYGDYYRGNAVSLCQWTNMPQTKWTQDMGVNLPGGKKLGLHMIENKVKSFEEFVKHLQKIEEHFWKVRFPVYDLWKVRMEKMYKVRGYYDTLTGFRLNEQMDKKQLCNYPVQGTAFHCLLYCLTELDAIFTKMNLQTKIVGQIHDAIVFDIYPPELERVCKYIKYITTVKLAQTFQWINVPMEIEMEIGGVDEPWSKLEPFKS